VSLRARLTLAGGGAVFVALALASVVVYLGVGSKLRDQIDVSLIQTAQNVAVKFAAAEESGSIAGGSYEQSRGPRLKMPDVRGPRVPPRAMLVSDANGYRQIIPSLSAALRTSGNQDEAASGRFRPSESAPNGFLPLGTLDRHVATGSAPAYFRSVTYHGAQMRVYTMRIGSTGDGLVRTVRPLTDANATIRRVRWLLIALTLAGAAVAALLGRLAAAAILRPVRNLARAVGEVTRTRDLNQRIPVDGGDEVGSLARNFNAMLAALEESQKAQQQLIADASHELRTPLTAHRANIELLARDDLPPERRGNVLAAAMRGIAELSTLVGDLLEVAREGEAIDSRQSVALEELVADAVERARAHAPSMRFDIRLEPLTVNVAPKRVTRAIDNVLDNAVKWSAPGATIEVTLERGLINVRDHGPGIDQCDLPHVLDRFYRAANARSVPGSGLGLAIVKATVEDHCGSVTVANAEGGGTIVTMRFDPPVG
jgi:two-component system sensor histidine kinase MprB